jgi:hypothetical protein
MPDDRSPIPKPFGVWHETDSYLMVEQIRS